MQEKHQNTTIHIPDGPRFILQKLIDAGHEAYVVGGCVRDSLMSTTPHDWDITTSATPEQARACFPGLDVIDTGLKHGTITVVYEKIPYEVTTFRKDGVYTDGRRPDEVTFVSSLHEDLMRRDFTMNAIAADVNGNLIDPFGGANDINRRIIRCVGTPEERFSEDALRILRAVRFASRLGFYIEENTEKAVHAMRSDLSRISAERIQKEFSGILCGKNVYRVLMDYRDVMAVFIPEIEACFDFQQNNPYHDYDVYQHTAVSVDEVPSDEILRLAMFFHDIGKPSCYREDENGVGHFHGHAPISADITEARLKALRFSNEIVRNVTELVFHHDTRFELSSRFARRMLNKLGEQQLHRLALVRKADIEAQSSFDKPSRLDKIASFNVIVSRVLQEEKAFRVKDLAVNGCDLIAAGMEPGPEIGRMLKRMLDAVIDESLENERDALLRFAAEPRKEE